MSDSWLLNPTVPRYGRALPTQATAFGSSSLASCSAGSIAYDDGRQLPILQNMTTGNHHHNNLIIVDEGKAPLGVDNRRRTKEIKYSKPSPDTLTVPNNHSLDSKYRLKY